MISVMTNTKPVGSFQRFREFILTAEKPVGSFERFGEWVLTAAKVCWRLV